MASGSRARARALGELKGALNARTHDTMHGISRAESRRIRLRIGGQLSSLPRFVKSAQTENFLLSTFTWIKSVEISTKRDLLQLTDGAGLVKWDMQNNKQAQGQGGG